MKHIRIIPRLDIKGPNLVKGIHLEGLRVLGSPEAFAKYYYENGADEIIFQDVVASLYERSSLHDLISRTAKNMFMPLTVGGGLRSIDDIKQVLRKGADKVALNTAVIRNPSFIKEASLKFGSSTIVIAIEAIKQADGSYLAFIDNGREETGVEVVAWAKRVEDLGAGEILITSVDKDGTGEGYDIELIKKISSAVSIPVIAHGGAASKEDLALAVTAGGVDALAIASMLHYSTINTLNIEMNNCGEGNTSFLNSGNQFKKILPSNISEIKRHLIENDISCRPYKPLI
jgi:cyclase